ncbi:MAG: peptidase S8 [Lysobacteraceae bacterium]|nr:MAG: peptidase S8 [Xanthomonadaceae bacterium]
MSHTTRNYRLRAIAAATALAFAATPALAGQFATGGLEAGQQYDRFIVKLRDAAPDAGQKTGGLQRVRNEGTDVTDIANQAMQALNFARVQGGKSAKSAAPLATYLRPMSVGADVIATSQKLDSVDAETLMRAIASHPDVEYVQVDDLLQPTFAPNDSFYGLQWGFFDADAGIRADQAWDIANGAGIIVAVIDTGITVHSDLNANQVPGYDFIFDPAVSVDGDGRDADPNDPGDTFTRASSWHGTHVAGTVAAVTNNAKGVAGTAWGAKVMPVRALGRGGGYTSDIADAITWSSGGVVPGVPTLAAGDVADIINMSLGGARPCDPLSQTVINGAVSRGTVVVVAAGNSNFDAANFSPASCNNVVNVASVTSVSARSGFSNFGSLIDVAAPGSTIASTVNSGATVPVAEGYAYYSGTSMAAPHVAGAVALAQSRRLTLGLPLWTPAEAEARLKATAYPLATPCPQGCGSGIIDAHALVLAAGGGPLQAELSAFLTGRPATITYGREATVGIMVRSRGPEVAPATRLSFSISNRVHSVEPIAPAGWTCTEQPASRSLFNFDCSFAGAYPAGRSDLIQFKVKALRSTMVRTEATITSDAVDDRPSNNTASYSFTLGLGT